MEENERCGIVYKSLEVKELINLHPTTLDNFMILEEELLAEGVVGTFHTHPRGSANLTLQDYRAFLVYPQLDHYIISRTEIWCFRTINGILCRYENPNLPRFPTNLMS